MAKVPLSLTSRKHMRDGVTMSDGSYVPRWTMTRIRGIAITGQASLKLIRGFARIRSGLPHRGPTVP